MENIYCLDFQWESFYGLEKFLNICVNALDNFAPRKIQYSRGNNMPLMNQTLNKAQMKRACLRNFPFEK